MEATVKISPSILSADLLHLGRSLDAIAGADFIHVDVMDGHFTSNLTYGVDVVRACKRGSAVPVDVHMMVTNPDATADWYIEAGADMITVHYEAACHLHRVIAHIKDRGCQAGVVLNPATPVCVLESIIEDVDMVLLMSVDPGFGGQSFIPSTLQKLRDLRALMRKHNVAPLVEIDGGVSAANVAEVVAAGANVIVAGSAVFGADDPAHAVEELRDLGNAALHIREA